MKYPIIILLFIQTTAWAQLTQERIEVKSRFLGEFGFFYNDKPLNIRQLKQIMAVNEDATQQLNTALKYRKAAGISSLSGVAFMGYYLFEVSQDRPETVWPVIVGGTLLLSAIPLNSIYSNKTEKAIETYNEGVPYNRQSSVQLEWRVSGLVLSF
ncbi:MAG: hypothetical protein LAT54_00695 [Cryomorphaceae bacterium]|nr:hypothetical protein [Cryomorphaceae bacterium]